MDYPDARGGVKLTKRRGEFFLQGDHTRLTNMSSTQEQLAFLTAQVEALTVQVAAIAGVLVRKEQNQTKPDQFDENIMAAGLLGEILSFFGGENLIYSNRATVVKAFEKVYAKPNFRKKVDPLCQKLREIYVASATSWREASKAAARPVDGILVNPDCNIYRKVETIVTLLAAERTNAIRGINGAWTKGYVDPRLAYIVTDVLPVLIAEKDDTTREILFSCLNCAEEIIAMAE